MLCTGSCSLHLEEAFKFWCGLAEGSDILSIIPLHFGFSLTKCDQLMSSFRQTVLMVTRIGHIVCGQKASP